MTHQDFITKWTGKTIDFDGAFGAQCVDLYRQYVQDVFKCPQSPPVSGAYRVWDTYLTDYFDRYNNTLTAVPQQGDVVIWNTKVGSGFGHIAIYDSGNVWGFTSFDQNWVTIAPHLQKHNYDNIYGWLRFKGGLDYKKMYEEQLARANNLQSKIDKAREALQ